MKKNVLMLAFLGLSLMVGCAQGANTSEPSLGESRKALVVEHSADELSALKADQGLSLDLTDLDTVYVVEYAALTDLDKVSVLTEEGESKLRELLGASVLPAQRVVIGADPSLVDSFLTSDVGAGASAFQSENGLGVSTQALRKVRCCDSCTDLGHGIGPLVCSGCRGCDD